jgi:hypothetical protein
VFFILILQKPHVPGTRVFLQPNPAVELGH